jgi:beta-phosphoglucomutase
MLKAIIFDFNGVILDDEPLHYQSMRDAVAEVGISITREEYWQKYLPLDDVRCLEAIGKTHRAELTAEMQAAILKRKSIIYHKRLSDQFPLFPGAAEMIRSASHNYPLALASGARREEIETTLNATDLRDCFRVIVAAEDFTLGKPHPESFLLALRKLNQALDGTMPKILPGECLVVEDSVGGIEGARAAGMMCLAVANSYPARDLQHANRVVSSLEEVGLDSLQQLTKERV